MRANRALSLLAIAGLFVSATILKADTTYIYSGPLLGTFSGYTLQNVPRVSGEFTTAAPLAANLNSVDIDPLVLSYSFSDSLFTWDQSNSQLGGINGGFTITTNEVGAISYWDLLITGVQQVTVPGAPVPFTMNAGIFSEGCPHADLGISGGGAPTNINPTAFYPCFGDDIGESATIPPEDADFFLIPPDGNIGNEIANGTWSVAPEPSASFPLMALSLAAAAVIFGRSRHSARERKMQQVPPDRCGS